MGKVVFAVELPEAPEFMIGDKVKKKLGYSFPGIVVSVFAGTKGVIRYVVEADGPGFEGMMHIFNGSQLEKDDRRR